MLQKETQQTEDSFSYVLNDSVFEIWIDAQNYYLLKIKVTSTEDDNQFTLAFDDFNQNFEFLEPEKTTGIQELFGQYANIVIGNFSENINIEEKETSDPMSDNDQDGLIYQDEIFWGTDPNNPDTDGDGYLDGEEIEHGYDPLVPGDARLEDR